MRFASITTSLVVLLVCVIENANAQQARQSEPSTFDISAARITHEPQNFSTSDGPVTISAIVTDNIGVENVTLFYRNTHGNNFTSVPMILRGESNYAATIPNQDITGSVIEYYIQAVDSTGNLVLRGSPQLPMRVEYPHSNSYAQQRVGTESNTVESILGNQNSTNRKEKYLQWFFGALIAGAIIRNRIDDSDEDPSPAASQPPTANTTIRDAPLPP